MDEEEEEEEVEKLDPATLAPDLYATSCKAGQMLGGGEKSPRSSLTVVPSDHSRTETGLVPRVPKKGSTDSARELSEIFVPPFHSEGDAGWTCLHWAARHGMVETVERSRWKPSSSVASCDARFPRT